MLGTHDFTFLSTAFSYRGRLILLLATLLGFSASAHAADYDWVEDVVLQQEAHAQELQLKALVEERLTQVPRKYKPKDECEGMTRANDEQLREVYRGVQLKEEFLKICDAQTGRKDLCRQVIRPNPLSRTRFYCTYPLDTEHVLVHPEKWRWYNAITAIQIISEIQDLGVSLKHIYNWWRPQPYNTNVSGDPDRHPFGTAVDVRFQTKEDQQVAFEYVCKLRKEGRVQAVGFYNAPSLHIGIRDPVYPENSKLGTVWVTDGHAEEGNVAICSGIGFAN